MSRIKALKQAKADCFNEMKALRDKIAAATTDEDRAALKASFKALETKYDGIVDDVKDEERMQERERDLTPIVDADAQAAASAATAARVETVPGGSADDKEMKKPGFFGRALQAVRKIAIREASDADLKAVKMLAGPTGASTDVPSDGGFLVAPERSNTIIQRMYDTGEVARGVYRLPIGPGSNGMLLPAVDETSRADSSRYGGIVSGWLGQGNTLTSGKPKFRLMDLKLRKVGAFVYATDELLVDAVALEGWINKYLPLELTFRTEDAIVNGDGSNKPAGFLNSGAAVSVTRNTSNRVLYEDVSGMWKRMWAPLRKSAVWMVDQSVEQELEQLSIAIGTAGVLAPIYKPAGVAVGPDGTQGYSPATLYGRPILTTEYNAALGTVGDITLVNLGEYTLIDKGGVDQAVSMHVAFLTDESVYRFLYRVDGQSNWNAALTPKSGGSTVSSIVTLAT